MEKIEEINVNEKLKKKIEYLEYLNSSLTQKNKLLENKLSNLTKKYNSLKNELYYTECHINFCKQNLLDLISFKKEESKNKYDKNFMIFKNKIKTLFEFGNEFMRINSDVNVYKLVIDNIKNLKDENITLNKNLAELKKIIHQNYENQEYDDLKLSPIPIKNYNNSQISEELIQNNNIYNYDTPSMDNEITENEDDYRDDFLYKTYQNFNHRLYSKYK
jgi:hypothetical protein